MKIIIKNLSRKVTADSLATIFSTYGNVTTSSILLHPKFDAASKTALIRMPNEKEAKKAIEHLNGCVIDGQVLQVRSVVSKTKAPALWYYKRVRHFFSPRKYFLPLN